MPVLCQKVTVCQKLITIRGSAHSLFRTHSRFCATNAGANCVGDGIQREKYLLLETKDGINGRPLLVMAPTLYDEKPKPGDLIEIFRGTYSHWSMFVGDDYIIHLAPPSEDACGGPYSMMSVLHDKATVKIDNLWDVVGTSRFSINNLLDDKYEPRSVRDILSDARSRVGQELPYCVFRGNCEHFVTELRYGKPESRQVRDAMQTALGVGAAAIGVGLLAAAAVAIFGSGRKERRNNQRDEARQ